jgi:hypothetical protein
LTVQTPKTTPLLHLIKKKSQEVEETFSGLVDNHIKVVDFIIKKDFLVTNCKYDLFLEENPRKLVIKVYGNDGKEVFLKPKSLNYFDKMVQFMELENWVFQFNKKGDL